MRISPKSKQGLSLVELMLVLAVVAAVILLSMRYFGIAQREALLTRSIAQVSEVVDASYAWLRGHNNFDSITIQKLSDAGYLTPNWKDGKDINPWGGDVSISSANSGADLLVTVTEIPTVYKTCDSIKNKLSSKAKSVKCTNSDKTFEGTF